MKIIKRGVLPEDKVFRGRCAHCGCEFEYIRSDIADSQREGAWVECPCCKMAISHKILR